MRMSVLNCFDIFTYSSHGSAEMVFVVANPVLQFYRLTSGKTRPGHIVLFQLPERHAHSSVELGLVLSIFKGIKAPKVFSGEASAKSIMAFRAVGLDMVLGGLPNFSFVWAFRNSNSIQKVLSGQEKCQTSIFVENIPGVTFVAGVHPEDGGGQVTIRLTEASNEVLEKVSGLQRWRVAPPMTRGSKIPGAAPAPKPKPKPKGKIVTL